MHFDTLQKQFGLIDAEKLPPVKECVVHNGFNHLEVTTVFEPVDGTVYKRDGRYYFLVADGTVWQWLKDALYIVWQ